MNIFEMFNPNACSIGGRDGSVSWNWEEYFKNKKSLTEKGIDVVLIDMINHPVEGSVPISNEVFEGKYRDGSYFALYCHSGGSSGALQKQLMPQLPQYHIINIQGGIGMYPN